MANGISQAASVVRETMGAAGRNVVIEIEQQPFTLTTNDGATIIEHIYLEDPVENTGLNFLKEVVARSNKNSGDGSSTTTVLVDAILQEGMKHESRGVEIMRSINECLPLIEKSIDEQKRIITADDFDRVKQVATTSCENEELGELLATIYKEVGVDGKIHPEYVLGKEGNDYSFIKGIRFAWGNGFGPFDMTYDEEAIKENRKETRAVYENPAIIVTKQKINSLREIDRIVEKISLDKDIVIFTNDMNSDVAQHMVATHKIRKENAGSHYHRMTIIRCSTLWREHFFEDFAKCTGATIVGDGSGITLKNFDVTKHLGTCGKIIIEKDETLIIDPQDISEHIQELQKVVDNGDIGDSDYERRLSWLTAKTVLLKIGGMSDTELSYKRLKLEDAINATKGALTDGIVAGGGIALLNAARKLATSHDPITVNSGKVTNPAYNVGKEILKIALQEPFRQICKNAGVDVMHPMNDEDWQNNTGESLDYMSWSNTTGFNTKTSQIVNMFDAGIIDSAKVTKMAVRNAISIASTLLTASTCLTLPPKPQDLSSLLALKPYPFQQ